MIIHFFLTLYCVLSLVFLNIFKVKKIQILKFFYANFILILFFLVIRYDYGNDYMSYYNFFYDLKNYGVNNISERIELGWLYLNKFFLTLGFFWLVGFLSVFQILVLVYFIKKYSDVRLYWISLFSFMVLPHNMLISISAMRQSFAITCYLLLVDSLLEKKYFKSFLLSLVAINIHNSFIIVLLPTLLVFLFKKINDHFYVFFSILLILVFYLLGGSIGMFFQNYLIDSFEKYAVYEDKGSTGTGIGLIIYFILFLFYLLAIKGCKNESHKIIIKLASFSYMLVPFTLYLGMLVRVIFYFEMLFVVSVGLVYSYLQNNILKYAFLFLFFIWTIYLYYRFSIDKIWLEKFSNYQTIFPSVIDYLF